MGNTPSPRHTRRGFLRAGSAPKFFRVKSLSQSRADSESVNEFMPPAYDLAPADRFEVLPEFPLNAELNFDAEKLPGQVSLKSLPVLPHVARLKELPYVSFDHADDELEFSEEDARTLEGQMLDFSPTRGAEEPDTLNDNAFLSWLADQLTVQAGETKSLSYVEDEFDLESDPFYPEAYFIIAPDDESAESTPDTAEAEHGAGDGNSPAARGKELPSVEIDFDGGRIELFSAGSKLIKDRLGRVVEVRSRYGDTMFFEYGSQGVLQQFQRTDANGRLHSEGLSDKHGVVIRDADGRVRAAGESMAVDPRGRFSLHSIDGQFFTLDLVTGIQTERRAAGAVDNHRVKYLTSVFTHDGFRMATMFTVARGLSDTISGDCTSYITCFRFYGRDGTVIEFSSEDDLRDLQPARVTAPASSAVSNTWQKHRQADTAWQSVHEYLMRVS